jgi:hypothetical protein
VRKREPVQYRVVVCARLCEVFFVKREKKKTLVGSIPISGIPLDLVHFIGPAPMYIAL